MIKLVIFDIDGTLVDAYGAIRKSLNFTMRKLGYPDVSMRRVKRAVGLGDREFIRNFFGKRDIEKAVGLYRSHHAKSLLSHSYVLRGARRILEALKKNGCHLAIVSNRPDPFCSMLLDHLDLAGYFDMILCARHRREIKPSPVMLRRVMRNLRAKPGETIYVGDMVVDVKAGRNAGVRTIAVTGGSSSRRELIRARPFKVISDIKGLTAALRDVNIFGTAAVAGRCSKETR
jgi:phosphoglycolate phosphatase